MLEHQRQVAGVAAEAFDRRRIRDSAQLRKQGRRRESKVLVLLAGGLDGADLGKDAVATADLVAL